jgi:hypothetical protein
MQDKINIQFPNDYKLSEVPIQNFITFQITKAFEDVVFGRCEGDDLYISMPKSEYLKIQEFKQNHL